MRSSRWLASTLASASRAVAGLAGRDAVVLEPEQHVVEHRRGHELGVGVLEHEADRPPGQPPVVPRHPRAVHDQFPLVGEQRRVQVLHQRRLPGTVGADERDHLAGEHPEPRVV